MGKQPYRVLQIVTTMNRGGAETMIMNHYRNIDHANLQFDFLVHREERGAYDDEIELLGGRIFRAPKIRPWKYLEYFKWLNFFFKKHAEEFIAIHGHIQENTGFAAYYAKKYGIKHRVANSHIATLGLDYKFLFRKFGKLFTLKYSTDYLACGNLAGKYLYGKHKFELLKNAIETYKFKPDKQVRSKIRKQMGFGEDDFVIINVARFCYQKNHSFLIKVFHELKKQKPEAKLLLVGDGPLKEQIKSQILRLDCKDDIKLLGLRSDIPELLQVSDLFFMPSKFEGLPVSVIEAQAAGLPCILSSEIDNDTDITGNIKFISLNEPISQWVKAFSFFKDFDRKNQQKNIIESGYDIEKNIKKLISYYGL